MRALRDGDAPRTERGARLSEEEASNPPETTQAAGAHTPDWMRKIGSPCITRSRRRGRGRGAERSPVIHAGGCHQLHPGINNHLSIPPRAHQPPPLHPPSPEAE
ncbi:unnamed protein product [Pleuronectes platessa]|uniref:Uncharacterized protein n=1 Tax=Pleuronectes platessa TaxID=8262 RepID=A0A9N7VM05_PLEPL|nr:unnamed protein product [Pleuronectes platessa]